VHAYTCIHATVSGQLIVYSQLYVLST
jgi:hypothetical protein